MSCMVPVQVGLCFLTRGDSDIIHDSHLVCGLALLSAYMLLADNYVSDLYVSILLSIVEADLAAPSVPVHSAVIVRRSAIC